MSSAILINSNLKKPELVVQLPKENSTEANPLKVIGVLSPLIAINGIVVPWQDISYFRLESRGVLPEVEFEFRDSKSLFRNVFHPTNENYLQVQILPGHEKCEKINLLFDLKDLVLGEVVSGRGSYKCKNFMDSRMVNLSEMSTSDLFLWAQKNTNLGLYMSTSTADKRNININNKSIYETLTEQVECSEATPTQVLDWWVDFWDCINLQDIYTAVKIPALERDMKIEVSRETGPGDYRVAEEIFIFTNSPTHESSNLYITGYHFDTDTTTHRSQGTSKMRTVYDVLKKQYVDHYLIDGDSMDDTINYEYGGEVRGYDRVFARECRDFYKTKILGDRLHVYGKRPLLGVTKYRQCRVLWLDNDGRINQSPTATIDDQMQNIEPWIRDVVKNIKVDANLSANKQVSGQYTIVGVSYIYQNGEWLCDYEMVKDRKTAPKIEVSVKGVMTDLLSPIVKEVDTSANEKISTVIKDAFGSLKSLGSTNWSNVIKEVVSGKLPTLNIPTSLRDIDNIKKSVIQEYEQVRDQVKYEVAKSTAELRSYIPTEENIHTQLEKIDIYKEAKKEIEELEEGVTRIIEGRKTLGNLGKL